ncbi:hypothetical protein [Streptomyces phaeoluteigriseus]|jgi:hypothetical protein|uniref:hypothetical protein n=1 Tax=Streptomyces phaeoluteigriseus TaxID=114686 RepID=UPI00117E5369|nr:hypothetical protein [Streptomyces phaeoluteigriseus]
MMLPHLTYADAVHAALTNADLVPDTLTVNAPVDTDDLTVLLQWNDMAIRWSSEAGWRHESAHSSGPLPLDRFADPAALISTAALLQQGQQPVTHHKRWAAAQLLDRAISDWTIALSDGHAQAAPRT